MMGGRGMMGRGRGGMMGGQVPPYAGLLINGKLPSDPVAVEVRRGERLRMRVMNPSGATTFRFAVGGHRLTVTHADGYPVRPVTVDALLVSMGERYDVVLEADNPGAWPIAASTVEGDSAPAQAVLRYRDAAATRPPAGALPEGLRSGRLLRLDDLRGVEDAPADQLRGGVGRRGHEDGGGAQGEPAQAERRPAAPRRAARGGRGTVGAGPSGIER